MKTITWFSTREELRELTGLPADDHDRALWDAGFNLDDWDFGFVSDVRWRNGWLDGDDGKYFEWWLLSHMENHCVGYEETEYNGKFYYIAHHS